MFKIFKINKSKIEEIKEKIIVTGILVVYWIIAIAIAMVVYPVSPIILLFAWAGAPTDD